MKKINVLLVVSLLIIAVTLGMRSEKQASAGNPSEYRKGEVLVKFVDGTNPEDIAATHKKNQGKQADHGPSSRFLI